jgi:hypothetical protein
MAYMRICSRCDAHYEAPPAAYNDPRIAPYCPRCIAREEQRAIAAATFGARSFGTRFRERCLQLREEYPDWVDPDVFDVAIFELLPDADRRRFDREMRQARERGRRASVVPPGEKERGQRR